MGAWVDFNNDKRVDLVTSGEWQPVRLFENRGHTFKAVTGDAGLQLSNEWWNCNDSIQFLTAACPIGQKVV